MIQAKKRCGWRSRKKSRRDRDANAPNENKMSDGGRERASLGVEVWKSSQKWSVQRSAVRSIAWLDLGIRGSESHSSVPTIILAPS